MKSKASGIKYTVYLNGIVYTKQPKKYHSTITNERILDYLLNEKLTHAKVDRIVEMDEDAVIEMLNQDSQPLPERVEWIEVCPHCGGELNQYDYKPRRVEQKAAP